MDADHREEMSGAGLSLGLIYGIDKSDRSTGKLFQLERCALAATSIEPALTLGLPGDRQESEKAGTTTDGGNACSTSRGAVLGRRPSSSDCRLSRIKTENGGKASPSRGSDGEEDGRARKKLRLSKEQSALLEDKFKEQTTLTTVLMYLYIYDLENLIARKIEEITKSLSLSFFFLSLRLETKANFGSAIETSPSASRSMVSESESEVRFSFIFTNCSRLAL